MDARFLIILMVVMAIMDLMGRLARKRLGEGADAEDGMQAPGSAGPEPMGRLPTPREVATEGRSFEGEGRGAPGLDRTRPAYAERVPQPDRRPPAPVERVPVPDRRPPASAERVPAPAPTTLQLPDAPVPVRERTPAYAWPERADDEAAALTPEAATAADALARIRRPPPPPSRPAEQRKRARRWSAVLDGGDALRRAVVVRELLGRPLALRGDEQGSGPSALRTPSTPQR